MEWSSLRLISLAGAGGRRDYGREEGEPRGRRWMELKEPPPPQQKKGTQDSLSWDASLFLFILSNDMDRDGSMGRIQASSPARIDGVPFGIQAGLALEEGHPGPLPHCTARGSMWWLNALKFQHFIVGNESTTNIQVDVRCKRTSRFFCLLDLNPTVDTIVVC